MELMLKMFGNITSNSACNRILTHKFKDSWPMERFRLLLKAYNLLKDKY